MLSAMQEVKTEYANCNVEVDDWALNNRTNFLKPHTYHVSLIEKALEEQIEKFE